jgi:hypothetical protein
MFLVFLKGTELLSGAVYTVDRYYKFTVDRYYKLMKSYHLKMIVEVIIGKT